MKTLIEALKTSIKEISENADKKFKDMLDSEDVSKREMRNANATICDKRDAILNARLDAVDAVHTMRSLISHQTELSLAETVDSLQNTISGMIDEMQRLGADVQKIKAFKEEVEAIRERAQQRAKEQEESRKKELRYIT